MMKRTFYSIVSVLLLFSYGNGQATNDLSRKWFLEGYVYWGFTFSPDDIEKNDYIHLKTDGNFTSIDEGEFEAGMWTWDAGKKTIELFNNSSDEPLSLGVSDWSNNELLLILEDDEDALTIKFKTAK